MQRHYEILGVSPDATPEEIRAQFKKLVRIYHPDRFSREDEKAHMSEKLLEINEAYEALAGKSSRRGAAAAESGKGTFWTQEPILVLQPGVLDFGSLSSNARMQLSFRVDNLGSEVKRFGLSVSPGDDWFSITSGKQVYPENTFPVEFTVAASTQQLVPGRRYEGWINITMDKTTERLPIALSTADQAGRWPHPQRGLPILQWTTLLMLLVALLLFFGQLLPGEARLASIIRNTLNRAQLQAEPAEWRGNIFNDIHAAGDEAAGDEATRSAPTQRPAEQAPTFAPTTEAVPLPPPTDSAPGP